MRNRRPKKFVSVVEWGRWVLGQDYVTRMEGRRGHLERTSSTVLWKRPASQRCGWLQGADPKAQQDLRRQVRRRLERDGRISIPQALRVTLILEGSVRRVGHRVRITAQLIDIAEDRPLWAQTYDRALPNILDIQSEVTARIVNALRAVIKQPTQPTLDETEYAVPAVHGGGGWLDRAFRG